MSRKSPLVRTLYVKQTTLGGSVRWFASTVDRMLDPGERRQVGYLDVNRHMLVWCGPTWFGSADAAIAAVNAAGYRAELERGYGL